MISRIERVGEGENIGRFPSSDPSPPKQFFFFSPTFHPAYANAKEAEKTREKERVTEREREGVILFLPPPPNLNTHTVAL